jgi:hypothetical protein
VTAVSVALRDEFRVDAERGIIQEYTPVNLAHIDSADPAGSDDPDRVFEVERQPQIPRKVVFNVPSGKMPNGRSEPPGCRCRGSTRPRL